MVQWKSANGSVPSEKSQTQGSAIAGHMVTQKIVHLDKDWKGIWKNQIYGIS